MTERPWESEPDNLDFEADGLLCAMLRNDFGVWCGYVSVGPEHPLFGLPTNHPLKLPTAWYAGRKLDAGTGPMDLFMHALSGKDTIEDGCPICLAFQVHGGVNYAEGHAPYGEPDGRWWFGFDCGHAGDYLPRMLPGQQIIGEMIESMPEPVRDTMRRIMARQETDSVYRDQQYVVGECQSLAAQLNAIVAVIDRQTVKNTDDNQRD